MGHEFWLYDALAPPPESRKYSLGFAAKLCYRRRTSRIGYLKPLSACGCKNAELEFTPLRQTLAQHMRSYLGSAVRKKPHPRKPAR